MILDTLRQKIEEDPVLSKIREKVIAGTSTLDDCWRYSIVSSDILGDVLGDEILQILLEQRQDITVLLMQDRYDDIAQMLLETQQQLDAKDGIHVGIKIPDFNLERATQIGGSLADETADASTIVRRAKSAPVTATKQIMDYYIRDNARIRNDLGFKTEVIRTSVAGCCPWCEEVAGVYLYTKEPEGIFRRHDNCDCMISYRTSKTTTNLIGSGKKWIENDNPVHILR